MAVMAQSVIGNPQPNRTSPIIFNPIPQLRNSVISYPGSSQPSLVAPAPFSYIGQGDYQPALRTASVATGRTTRVLSEHTHQ